MIGGLAEVARMGLLAMHYQNGGANLIDVVEEAGVGVGLCADGAPAVVGVAAAGVIAARGLIIVVVIPDKLRGVGGQRVDNTAGHGAGIGKALLCQGHAGLVTSFLIIVGVEVTVAADTSHIIHGRGEGSLDARVGGCGVESDASPSADAYDADLRRVDHVKRREVVDGGHEILGVDVGRGCAARFTAALAGKRGVEGDRHKSALCHAHGVEPARLLLAGAEGPADGDGGHLPCGVLRRVEIGGQRQAELGRESHLPVVYFFAQRERFVPLLRKCQFLFHIFSCYLSFVVCEARELCAREHDEEDSARLLRCRGPFRKPPAGGCCPLWRAPCPLLRRRAYLPGGSWGNRLSSRGAPPQRAQVSPAPPRLRW